MVMYDNYPYYISLTTAICVKSTENQHRFISKYAHAERIRVLRKDHCSHHTQLTQAHYVEHNQNCISLSFH